MYLSDESERPTSRIVPTYELLAGKIYVYFQVRDSPSVLVSSIAYVEYLTPQSLEARVVSDEDGAVEPLPN
jgi:hypothetical protein